MDNWDDIYKSLGYLPNSIQHLGVILQLDGGLVVKVCWLGGCGVTRDGGGVCRNKCRAFSKRRLCSSLASRQSLLLCTLFEGDDSEFALGLHCQTCHNCVETRSLCTLQRSFDGDDFESLRLRFAPPPSPDPAVSCVGGQRPILRPTSSRGH